MCGCFGVKRHGYGGGLALLWNSSVALHIQSYSNHHIDVNVLHEDGMRWRVTGFYGHPKSAMRVHSWALLRQLHRSRSMPWSVMGNFNEITSLDEQWGRGDRSLVQMEGFREVLSEVSLLDLGYFGLDFTWSNRCRNGALVHVRLNRCVTNEDWMLLFPHARVLHVVVVALDHMGLLTDLNPPQLPSSGSRKKRFRFEHMWVHEMGYKEAIQAAWDFSFSSSPMYIVAQKIKQCRVHLLQWSKTQLRFTPQLIESKKA